MSTPDNYYNAAMDYIAEDEERREWEEKMDQEAERDWEEMERREEEWYAERYKRGFFVYIYYVLEDAYYYLESKLTDFYYRVYRHIRLFYLTQR